ncbi:hypothetical protein [Aquitalea sp. USM4]|uniref:hypothetical protein n=1 Tax=Aquitalea sp. USM4 TaxID=1590041 RepID=UPI001038B6A8|nr:hypothetical protein [Aquitalea sp. USM4]QBJ79767.1 hypothetical protein DKK66_17880 [Aquitalea sp. USM4]
MFARLALMIIVVGVNFFAVGNAWNDWVLYSRYHTPHKSDIKYSTAQFSTGQESVLPEIPEFCWAIIIFIIVRQLPELAIRVVVCVFSKDAAMSLGGWILPIKLVPE